MKLLAAIALPTLALDWTTKRWAECALAKAPRAVVGDFVHFALAHNPGGAWSTFAQTPERLRLALFGGVGLAAVVALVLMHVRGGGARASFGARIGAPLVLGGALGNLVDRFLSGYVVDFVSVPHWPTFNVADVAISVGVALLALDAASRRSAPPETRTVSQP